MKEEASKKVACLKECETWEMEFVHCPENFWKKQEQEQEAMQEELQEIDGGWSNDLLFLLLQHISMKLGSEEKLS